MCGQTAIHNLHATSLNGTLVFILRKGEQLFVAARQKAAVRTISLVYILYYTLFALPFQLRLYVRSLLSWREVASKVSPADAFYGRSAERSAYTPRCVRLSPISKTYVCTYYVHETPIRLKPNTLALVTIYAYRQFVACI